MLIRALILLKLDFLSLQKKNMSTVKKISNVIKNSKVCALARHNTRDIDLAVDAIGKKNELHVFIPTSDIHIKYKLNLNRRTDPKKNKRNFAIRKKKISDIENQ